MPQKLELVSLLHDAVQEATDTAHGTKEPRIPRVVLLEALDKRPSTFDNELNPWPNPECRNKLGLEDAFHIMQITGDTSVLEYMAGVFGLALRPVSEADPDGRDMTHECLQGYEATSAYLTAAHSGSSYQSLISSLPSVIKELEDVAKRARMEQVKGKLRPAYMKKAG